MFSVGYVLNQDILSTDMNIAYMYKLPFNPN